MTLVLKPGQIEAKYITTGQSGLHTGTCLEQGAAYRADQSWGGGAILKKLEKSDARLPTITCTQEIFDLFRKHKKRGDESISQGIERLIREAPSVR